MEKGFGLGNGLPSERIGSERSKDITFEELASLRDAYCMSLGALYDGRLDDAQIAEGKQKKRIEFLERLRAGHERFQYIFKTEKGSVYFVDSAGDCLRFRHGDEGYEVGDLTRKTIFVEPEVAAKLMSRVKEIGGFSLAEALVGQVIPKTPFGIGKMPIEFGYYQTKVAMEETDQSVTILGTEHRSIGTEPFETHSGETVLPGGTFIDQENVMGFHVGHAIVEIEKG